MIPPSIVRLAFRRRKIAKAPTYLRTPAEIASLMAERIGNEPQEHFESLHFNVRNELLSIHEISVGGMSCAMVDPRVVFAGALLSGACAIVLCHNHPSGDPDPSTEDLNLTRQLEQGARVLGLKVLDHVIVATGGKFVSMYERGMLTPVAKLSSL